ncbi:glycosyltransferase family 2 protein [Streptomyces thinghirensis]|nr:glycosyltransferase family 2 protein [Streptomyces thinghirensis]
MLPSRIPDLELIAVDDCSPDACARSSTSSRLATRAYARRAPAWRTRVRPRPQRRDGERASGDYLVFLDGDDTLVPDALRAIADRVKEDREPDVLVHTTTRASPGRGDAVRNQAARLLTEQGPAPFRLTIGRGLLETADGGLEQDGVAEFRRARGASPSRPATTRTRRGPTRSC